MGERLKERIKQQTFQSPFQMATLNIIVAADFLNRKMEAFCEEHGITGAQYNVLRILRGVHPGGHPRREIIARMLQVAPDVTRLIDRLEKAGLVRRGKGKEDARLSLTFITPQGLTLLKRMQKDVDAFEAEMSTCMSEKDAVTLSRLCEKIYGA